MLLSRNFLSLITCGLLFLSGCAGIKETLVSQEKGQTVRPSPASEAAGDQLFSAQPESPDPALGLKNRQSVPVVTQPASQPMRLPSVKHEPKVTEHQQSKIQHVSHLTNASPRQPVPPTMATLNMDGRTYRVQLVEESKGHQQIRGLTFAEETSEHIPAPSPLKTMEQPQSTYPAHLSGDNFPNEAIPMNLSTALSMIGGQHPTVGFAQWRVEEAFARFDQARVLWLPSIQPGFSFHDHDGNYQASNGDIVDVDRNSFQYGLGAGATGAGTTPRPGVVAQFHVADAIFQPDITEKTAWARGHAATGILNEQLLTVAIAYLELLDAEQDVQILEENRARTQGLAKITSDFAATGQGLQSDADRMETELILIDDRLLTARERTDVASARLTQALSIEAGRRIMPLDPTVVPIDLVSLDMDKGALISTGLSNRPELKEAQALVSAAIDQYDRQKYAPFVPSVLLGFSNGGFGGGLGRNLSNVDDRVDFDAIATWEIRNLGFGEGAARRQSQALIEQAKYEKIRRMDQVAREVSEAHTQVLHRAERIRLTRNAIQSAKDSYERNLSRIRDGLGLPIEVLQSVQALEDAQRAYLKAVIEYDQAQFRLQWALGWPVNSTPVRAN